MNQKLNIFLDIDDVVAAWQESYCKEFNRKPSKSWDENREEMNYHLSLLKKRRSFWTNIPVKHFPDFQPNGYLSARSIPKAWTKEFMRRNKIPGRSNINQVPWNVSKIDKLKQFRVQIFIDDKLETFLECHENGIFCLLMDASHNQSHQTNLRINDLKYENILNKYNQYFKNEFR